MKVKDLIKDLQSYNGDLEVQLDLYDWESPDKLWLELDELLPDLIIIQGSSLS